MAMLRQILIIALVLTFQPLFAQSNHDKLTEYTNFVKVQQTAPFDYLTQKVKQYNVVTLGEDHWVRDHMEFLSDYLRHIAADTTFHLDALAWESGNSIDQGIADSLMRSATFREDLALQILRDAPDTYGWPYTEAVDALRALWEYNRKQQKFTRLLLLDPPYMLQMLNGEKYEYTLSRDQSTANKIATYIYTGKRVIYYAGSSHTQKQFHAQYVEKSKTYAVQATAGKILATLYPHQVFSIKLWGGLMGNNGYIPANDDYHWERCGDGIADEALRTCGNKPIGFDVVDSPFASEKVSDFFHFDYTDRMLSNANGSPYYADETMGNRIDGIIFFRPVDEFTVPHIETKLFNDDFIKRVSKRTKGKVNTLNDVLNYIKQHHPTLAAECDRLMTD